MEWIGITGKLYQLCHWVMKLLIVNLIWIGFNFPVVYLALATLDVRTIDELYLILFTMIALLPFILFPATAAMFALVRRAVIHRIQDQLFRTFWRFYRQNYLQSMTGGIIFTIIWGIWLVNYQLLNAEIGSGLFYIYLLLTVFLLAFTSYFVADIVHVHLNVWSSLKKACMISLAFPHYTIASIGVSTAALYILYQIHPLFFILYSGIVPTVIVFLSYYLIVLRASKMMQANMEAKKAFF